MVKPSAVAMSSLRSVLSPVGRPATTVASRSSSSVSVETVSGISIVRSS